MPRSPPTLTGVHDLLRPVLEIPHGCQSCLGWGWLIVCFIEIWRYEQTLLTKLASMKTKRRWDAFLRLCPLMFRHLSYVLFCVVLSTKELPKHLANSQPTSNLFCSTAAFIRSIASSHARNLSDRPKMMYSLCGSPYSAYQLIWQRTAILMAYHIFMRQGIRGCWKLFSLNVKSS